MYTFNATGGNTPGDYTAYVQLAKADNNAANDVDDAVLTLTPIRDLAVNITATPVSGVVGSGVTYTVNM